MIGPLLFGFAEKNRAFFRIQKDKKRSIRKRMPIHTVFSTIENTENAQKSWILKQKKHENTKSTERHKIHEVILKTILCLFVLFVKFVFGLVYSLFRIPVLRLFRVFSSKIDTLKFTEYPGSPPAHSQTFGKTAVHRASSEARKFSLCF